MVRGGSLAEGRPAAKRTRRTKPVDDETKAASKLAMSTALMKTGHSLAPTVPDDQASVDGSLQSESGQGNNFDWMNSGPSTGSTGTPVTSIASIASSAPSVPAGQASVACTEDYQDKIDEVDQMLKDIMAMPVLESDTSGLDKVVKDFVTKAAETEMSEAAPDIFMKAGGTGEFDIRDAVGQRFAREHMKGSAEHEKYHQCGTREEKKTFRENWAKKRFQDYTVGKAFDKSFSSIDTTLGEYMTFGATVIKYGGWTWSPAVTGALSTAAKCTALGGKWISIDEFSGLPMFFVLQRQHADIFAKKWSEFEKHLEALCTGALNCDDYDDVGRVIQRLQATEFISFWQPADLGDRSRKKTSS